MIGAVVTALAVAAVPLLVGLVAAERRRARLLARIAPAGMAAVRFRRLRMDPRLLVPGCAVLGWVAGQAVAGPPGAVIIAGGAATLVVTLRRRQEARHRRRVEEQLIDAVSVLSSALRTGRSLAQALEVASSDVGDPLGRSLARIGERVRLGEPLDDALRAWEEEVGGADGRLLAGVLRLHRRTGGALASALDDLGRTLRSRLQGERELRGLTAQARLSAAILGLLPLGFFLFLSVVSRRDIETAYRTTLGASAIGLGAVLEALAFLWIRRILRVPAT